MTDDIEQKIEYVVFCLKRSIDILSDPNMTPIEMRRAASFAQFAQEKIYEISQEMGVSR